MPGRRIHRYAFFVLLLGLCAQFFVAKLLEEPYPSLVFPGFGKVPPADPFPYPYERLRWWAYSPTDSVALTIDELFAPFPEKALYIPIRKKLKTISPTITPTIGNAQERALLHYLQERVAPVLGGKVQRLELAFYQYRANRNGDVQLAAVTHRKRFIFY
jgi:hypothetical protein